MDDGMIRNKQDFAGKVVVVTGGSGVLCSAICRTLAGEGAKVAILDINCQAAEKLAAEIQAAGKAAMAVECDVLAKDSLQGAAETIRQDWGRVDMLINGAGGNSPRATTGADQSFFDIPEEAVRWVLDLNLTGTVLASQVFGRLMAEQRSGIILNISSMNSYRPLTRIPVYSAAKAAVSNFTQWLAVHMAQEYSPEIRVNAIAPGFMLTEQNRYLLVDQATGSTTPRGRSIIEHTPMGRFGTPQDLLGAVMWLLSPGSAFVTGIVVPIDGGYSAYSGV